MRVLHVVDSLDPARGGPPQVVTRLAGAQVGLGHDVTVLTRDEPERRQAIADSIGGLPNAEGITIAAVPGGGGLGRILGKPAERWVAGHGGFDFAHLHALWGPMPHGATRALRARAVPYTLCPHGMLDHWSMAQSALKKKIHMALISGKTLRGCAFIHALNEHEAACVDAFGFGPPSEVLNNGVFRDEYEDLPEPGSFRSSHPELGDRPFVVFMSRLHFKKGLDHLAGAFIAIRDTHPDAHLVVIGPDDGAQAAFEREIGAVGLGDRVHLTGPMYGREKLAALVDASCFCLPSRQEGFSIAICEALACGTPVVITEECNFPEVGASDVGIVVPLSTENVAEGLDRVLSDPAAGAEMGQRGREMILTRFTWPKIAERSIELYEKYR